MLCGSCGGSKANFEHRDAENRLERLPELATGLVQLNVDLVAASGTLAPLAAKRATSIIPIVMTAAGDPLGSGLVARRQRHGLNVATLIASRTEEMYTSRPRVDARRFRRSLSVKSAATAVVIFWSIASLFGAITTRA